MNAYKGTDYANSATLFLEFSGSEASVEEDVEKACEIAESEGYSAFEFESDEAGRERLWEARHEAGIAVRDLHPEGRPMTTDVCVPVPDLPGALRYARETSTPTGKTGPSWVTLRTATTTPSSP